MAFASSTVVGTVLLTIMVIATLLLNDDIYRFVDPAGPLSDGLFRSLAPSSPRLAHTAAHILVIAIVYWVFFVRRQRQ